MRHLVRVIICTFIVFSSQAQSADVFAVDTPINEDTVFQYIQENVLKIKHVALPGQDLSNVPEAFLNKPLIWRGNKRIGLYGEEISRFGELFETSFKRYANLIGSKVTMGTKGINIAVFAEDDALEKSKYGGSLRVFSGLSQISPEAWQEDIQSDIDSGSKCKIGLLPNKNGHIVSGHIIIDTSIRDDVSRRCAFGGLKLLLGLSYLFQGSDHVYSRALFDAVALHALYGGGESRQSLRFDEESLRARIRLSLKTFSPYLEKTHASFMTNGWGSPVGVRVVQDDFKRYEQSLLSIFSEASAFIRSEAHAVESDEDILIVSEGKMEAIGAEARVVAEIARFVGDKKEAQAIWSEVLNHPTHCVTKVLSSGNNEKPKGLFLLETKRPPSEVRTCISVAVRSILGVPWKSTEHILSGIHGAGVN